MIKIGDKYFMPNLLLKPLVALPVILFIWLIILINKKKHQKAIVSLILDIPFMLYIYLLLGQTIFPIAVFLNGKLPNIISKYGIGRQYFIQLNPMAIFKYSMTYYGFINIVGNVILLVPLVIFISFYWPQLNNFKSAVQIAFFGSLTIELIQLVMNLFYISNRLFDVDDLILNTLGGIIAFFILKIFKRIFPNIFNVLSTEGA
ncbi:VanZ family protein [Periweissella cryptocerci]|uniref:VanZ family protein n=1 Tax=Periweissella cryptocerci TaxID=2506420 RepID=A0A4P6YWJ3_9LACO|nr:VanZ family protein [Periweissella cryptocerci]QBO37204.1 VanZ family protein [Periweissella cryptocerci]